MYTDTVGLAPLFIATTVTELVQRHTVEQFSCDTATTVTELRYTNVH